MNRMIDAIEDMQPQMELDVGVSFGAKLSAADSTIIQHGDPSLALAVVQ